MALDRQGEKIVWSTSSSGCDGRNLSKRLRESLGVRKVASILRGENQIRLWCETSVSECYTDVTIFPVKPKPRLTQAVKRSTQLS